MATSRLTRRCRAFACRLAGARRRLCIFCALSSGSLLSPLRRCPQLALRVPRHHRQSPISGGKLSSSAMTFHTVGFGTTANAINLPKWLGIPDDDTLAGPDARLSCDRDGREDWSSLAANCRETAIFLMIRVRRVPPTSRATPC